MILDKIVNNKPVTGDKVLFLLSDRCHVGKLMAIYDSTSVIECGSLVYSIPNAMILGSVSRLSDSVIDKRAFVVGNINSFVTALHKLSVKLDRENYEDLVEMLADAESNDECKDGDTVLIVWSTDDKPLETSKYKFVFDVYKVADNNFLKLAIC